MKQLEACAPDITLPHLKWIVLKNTLGSLKTVKYLVGYFLACISCRRSSRAHPEYINNLLKYTCKIHSDHACHGAHVFTENSWNQLWVARGRLAALFLLIKCWIDERATMLLNIVRFLRRGIQSSPEDMNNFRVNVYEGAANEIFHLNDLCVIGTTVFNNQSSDPSNHFLNQS